MTLRYGYIKAKITSEPTLRAKELPQETQYHLHLSVDVAGQSWDVAVNVGTNDAHDLLKYKIVPDFHHTIVQTLTASSDGAHDLTNTHALPALDFLRSEVLSGTGPWLESDVMDGSQTCQPSATLKGLLDAARQSGNPVYVFGRFYAQGNGIHDIHLNQGSRGRFLHHQGNDANDHNDIWQDGALFIDQGGGRLTVYVSAFQQQFVPTDDLGNPLPDGHTL